MGTRAPNDARDDGSAAPPGAVAGRGQLALECADGALILSWGGDAPRWCQCALRLPGGPAVALGAEDRGYLARRLGAYLDAQLTPPAHAAGPFAGLQWVLSLAERHHCAYRRPDGALWWQDASGHGALDVPVGVLRPTVAERVGWRALLATL